MKFSLVTLAGEQMSADIYEVIIPTEHGEISVFPGHEPLITVARPGVVMVRYEKHHNLEHVEYYAISGGVVEITGEFVRILVDEADRGADILAADTQAALDRALAMRDEAKDQVELEKAHQLVDRHMVRLRVADLHRRKRNH